MQRGSCVIQIDFRNRFYRTRLESFAEKISHSLRFSLTRKTDTKRIKVSPLANTWQFERFLNNKKKVLKNFFIAKINITSH